MPAPIDAYRAGYEKGRKDTLGGGLAELTMGMLRDDPGGHFAAGYRDGAAGKKFNPPSLEVRKAPPREAAESSATSLESAWFGLCDSSDFIPKDIVDYYVAALSAEGSHAEIVVGLSDFVGHTCPKCKAEGQFKVHFLGRLEHPACHWAGYMGTGSYIGFQITKILHSGIRAGGSMKEGSDKKGESGGWIYAIFGFLFVGMFRAALAVVLIPLHTIVALCQPKESMSERITRVVVLAVFAIAVGIGGYEINQIPKTQVANPQRAVMVPPPAPRFATSPGTRPVESTQPAAAPQAAVPQDVQVVTSQPTAPQQTPEPPQPQTAQERPPSQPQPGNADVRLGENRRLAREAYDRALVLGKAGSYDEASTNVERAIQLDPDLADAYVERGAIKGVRGQCEAAIQEFNRALGLNPRLPRAYSDRGNCYWNLKNVNQAIQDYTASIALDSTQAEVFATRGMAYGRLGEWPESETDLREAISLGSQNPSAHYNLGYALFKQQRYLESIRYFDQAIALQPSFALAFHYRGMAKQAIGQTAEGLTDLQRAHALDPQM
jgi:tetratricopeptide (TPR) repeat protein